MRYILLLTFITMIFTACKKDKFTTEPKIAFKSLTPDFYKGNTPDTELPVLTLTVTDAEGDLGYIDGTSASYIYIKNSSTQRLDSALLPNIKPIAIKNFDAEISIFMKQFLGSSRSTRDTIYYEVYITDFAKHKSNVLKVEKPVYYIP